MVHCSGSAQFVEAEIREVGRVIVGEALGALVVLSERAPESVRVHQRPFLHMALEVDGIGVVRHWRPVSKQLEELLDGVEHISGPKRSLLFSPNHINQHKQEVDLIQELKQDC